MISSLRMNAFEAFKLYVAIKAHFTTKKYDFFKHNGAVKVNENTFNNRNDRYFFQKLSKRKDIKDFLVSVFVYGESNVWVGDFVRSEQYESLYNEWQKVKQSLTYIFKNELYSLTKEDFIVHNGQHPVLLKKVLSKQVHVETFIILNDFINFAPLWNKQIQESIIWPSVKHKCKKYHPFIEYDREKFKQIVVDWLKETSDTK